MTDKKKAAKNRQSVKKRHKKQRKQFNAVMRLAAVMVSLLVAAVVIFSIAPKRSHTVIINRPSAEPEVQIAAPAVTRDTVTLAPTPTEETPAGTAVPAQDATSAESTQADAAAQTLERRQTQASAFEYLPVYRKADITDRKIAITVDDCFQVENLQEIARTAYQSGGKLTLFPIGENLSKAGMQDTLKTCVFKLGYEVENHTWSHERIFRLPEMEMAEQIWRQSEAVNQTLGANYEQHFFRLMGGDGDSDQRTHNYLDQLGFKGIANWSVSGSDSSLEACKEALAPGQIYLFHTTDADTEKLRQFIPYVAAQGYQMVTLNELLGYADNAVTAYAAQSMPLPRQYAEDYRTHKLGDYAWNVVLMQDKLRSLGFLVMDGPSTGYYGEKTVQAVMMYQQSIGLPPTGMADSETQLKLLA